MTSKRISVDFISVGIASPDANIRIIKDIFLAAPDYIVLTGTIARKVHTVFISIGVGGISRIIFIVFDCLDIIVTAQISRSVLVISIGTGLCSLFLVVEDIVVFLKNIVKKVSVIGIV